ncbi:PREDICTED: uncharacterized protein LOC106114383 [Papilio xuthus]|uniref:Uncharacterized protein LOC106114383 n=1 Tax=Papilio xuthus TaxID=66420 RepID=A0A194QEA2_PAPXU|nr:PREDICTED: uncharacterized protein LOC106114383 [Papilio xuthus]KPJ03275.1 hypothetical protein RR46_06431 [Papilio xuthus]
MRVLVAITLLSVAWALPAPNAPAVFDFRSLFAPQDADLSQDSGTAVNFVNSPLNEDEGRAVHFVDSPQEDMTNGHVIRSASNFEEISEDDNIVRFVDIPTNEEANDGVAIDFVDSPVEPISDDSNVARFSDNGMAVNFVDTPIEQADDGAAVHFVDNVESAAEDSAISAFAGMPLNEEVHDDGTSINFVNSPMNEILEAGAADIILIGHVFEPISASELETINVELPEDFYDVHYPGKIYDNPMLR